jgi:hypothetical protein
MIPRPHPRQRRPQLRRPGQRRSQQRVQKRPRTYWLGRLLRGWRLDRNPLRRKSDRAETVVLGILLAVFLAGAPFAAHAVGGRVYISTERQAQAQQATLHHVPATLLQAAPSSDAYAGQDAVPAVSARWRAPDGQARTGSVYVPGGAAAGSKVLVWIDQSGQQTAPPLGPGQITDRVQLAEEFTVIALAVALVIVGGLVHRRLNARRLAGWDADWPAYGPRWSPRR